MLSPTKILRNERKHLQSFSTWASFACLPETRKRQGDSTNSYISFYNEIHWKSHSFTLTWYVSFDSWWLVHCDCIYKTCFFMKTMEDQPSSILRFSHRFPSKKMNQTSLLAHNNLTKHLWAKDHWLFWNLWKIRKQKEAQKRIVQASGQF